MRTQTARTGRSFIMCFGGLLAVMMALILTACGKNGGGAAPAAPAAPTPPTLSGLSLSAGLLNPTFDSATTNYSTMFIGNTSVTVTPTAADTGTTITVNGTPVTSGAASGTINVSTGTTAITVALTGTNGATNTYTITTHRLAQQAYVKASHTGSGDYLGYRVALDGDTLAVASVFEDGSGAGVNPTHDNAAGNSGAVYVFTRSGSTWTQQAYIKASNTQADDQFGFSLALAGDTLAVGAPNEDGSATGVNQPSNEGASNSGAVYVFARSGGTWTQQGYAKASNTGADDWFGFSVALSGDTLAVGAMNEDGSATGVNGTDDNVAANSGAAYVFTRSGGTWTQQAYVKASNTGVSDQFGRSVALSGDTLAVGAAGEDSSATGIDGNQADDSAVSSGAVYVFTRGGTTWSQQAYVKASNTGASDQFGQSLSLSTDTLAVGAQGEDSNGTGVNSGAQTDNSASNSGAAYVFTRSGTAWSQQAYVKASNAWTGDNFGTVVSVDGDALIVGTGIDFGGPYPSEDSAATGINGDESDNSLVDSGAAYVFRRVGTTWTQQAYVKASNTGSNDLFGTAVAVSGDTIAVGAYLEDSNATTINPGAGAEADNSAISAGAVYVFQ